MKKMPAFGYMLLLALAANSQENDSVSGQNIEQVSAETAIASDNSVSELRDNLKGLEESYLETKATVDKLKKISLSGYIQTQFRMAADTTGRTAGKYPIGDFQGGRFAGGVTNVFQLRRARVKVAYQEAITQAVVQLDCLPFTTSSVTDWNDKLATDSSDVAANHTKRAVLSGGGVTVKDAYLKFNEPWLKSLGIKAGIYDRPFGFEISYSSSSRESPERSRVFQTLFPGERDLGISLEYLPSDNLPLWAQHFNLKAGAFAGNGINIEIDDHRDFIGRLGFAIPLTDINLSIDGGFSGYFGSLLSYKDSLYEMSGTSFTGTAGNLNEKIARRYLGADLQLSFGNIPVLGGSALRGEYLTGLQPGTRGSTGSPKSDQATKSVIYLRDFAGFYGMLVQNIDPLRSQLVVKYDSYDPNTALAGNEVNSPADMQVATVGGGMVFHWDEKVKFIAYYDRVMNEKVAKAPYTEDVSDDVFTFRIQYKF